MSNPSKVKGTRGETKVARYLTERGVRTTRRALAGAADEGDLRVSLHDGTEVTLEVKAGVQTSNYGRALFTKWKRETLAEGKVSGCDAALVIVRHRRTLANAEVWIPHAEWQGDSPFPHGTEAWVMMYLDDFADWLSGGRDAT